MIFLWLSACLEFSVYFQIRVSAEWLIHNVDDEVIFDYNYVHYNVPKFIVLGVNGVDQLIFDYNYLHYNGTTFIVLSIYSHIAWF